MMDISDFLVKAKTRTYATEGEGNEKVLPDGSKELTFEEGPFRYRDRYFGQTHFVGEEVVWKDGKVVWGMNYHGRTLAEPIPTMNIYSFLQKSLRAIKKDRPFRGPDRLKEGDLEYVNQVSGSVSAFSGTERILHKGKDVFILDYHGGEIKG